MGSSARAATAPKKRLRASAKPAPVVPSKPVGIPGGGNFSGRLMTVEPNQLLREQSAFGRAGTQTIGEWADLALTNPYVTAGLDFICAPISDARIDIEVDEESEDSQQVVDFLRWALEKRFKLAAHNDTAARGFLVSGFALFEPRAELAHCPVLGRDAFALAALEQRLPNSLSPNAWREDAEGRLVSVEQQGPRGGAATWTTLQLPAKDVLLYSWKRLGNNWAGESQLRSVWYLANRIMPMLLKLVGVTTQREGAGLPVGFAKDEHAEITPSERTELMTYFANATFHEAAGIVMPKGFDVKWIHSPGANKGFVLDIWKALGLVVLQQLGAQQMVLGTDNTGSRSVGEVHDARAMAFVRKVLSFQEGVLNGDGGESHTGLVSRLLKWNGLLGAGAVPRVKLTPKRPEMPLSELATALTSLKSAGAITITFKDENVIRERAGLPPLAEEERAEAKEKAAALAPQPQPGFPSKGEPEDEPEEKDEKTKAMRASARTWMPSRPLRASEKNLRLNEMDVFYTRQRDTYDKTMRNLVAAAMADATKAIEAAMADGVVRPEEIAAVPLDLSRARAFVKKFLRETADAGGRFLRGELADRPLRAASPEDDEDAVAEADEVLAAQTNAIVRRVEARLRGEVEQEAVTALRKGDTAGDVIARTMLRQVESGAFKSDAGLITTTAFNVGREEAAALLGGIAEVELSEVLDNNTCEVCESKDGQTAEYGSPEHDALMPPTLGCEGREKCRGLLVYKMSRGGDE